MFDAVSDIDVARTAGKRFIEDAVQMAKHEIFYIMRLSVLLGKEV